MIYNLAAFADFSPRGDCYGLFGCGLGHSISPELHSLLFHLKNHKASYILIDIQPHELPRAFALAKQKLRGINITMPYKNAIIPLLDQIPAEVRALASVNTVLFKKGVATGYNTDILGFADSLARADIHPKNKQILLLGYGGAAAVLAAHCLDLGGRLTVAGRDVEKCKAFMGRLRHRYPRASLRCCSLKKVPEEMQIVLNATPVGMREDSSPLGRLPRATEYVFDAIYNPMKTKLIKKALYSKIPCDDGLYMLLMQAVYAQKLWNGTVFSEKDLHLAYQLLMANLAVKRLGQRNIVICGFMGCGKSTVAKKLARLTAMELLDVDKLLEEKFAMPISDFFAAHGEAAFRKEESRMIQAVSQKSGVILSTGGGTLLKAENRDILRKNGILFHINSPLSHILRNTQNSTRRPLLNTEDRVASTTKLFYERLSLYKESCDFSLYGRNIGDIALQILRNI